MGCTIIRPWKSEENLFRVVTIRPKYRSWPRKHTERHGKIRQTCRQGVHIRLVTAIPNARFVEFMPDDDIVNFRRVIDHRAGRARRLNDTAPTGRHMEFGA
jgi:hypothetical protein